MSATETLTSAPDTAKARATLAGDTGVLLCLVLFVALVAAITATFGLQGLAMSALAMVPVVFAVLILITVGK
ncbi:hypothetical protein [Tropicibacter sp. S64]|uniref:hypothetical protein n=1 Tax=Tropicibacter sp. S64 TaxID=3415122 RepID=UPI003C7AB7B1